MSEYHFGFNQATDKFILWRSRRQGPVAEISFADALGLMSTVAHVASQRFNAEPEPAAVPRPKEATA